MSNAARGPGMGATFLVAGVLLLTAGGVALAVVPVTECPVLAASIERTVQGTKPGVRDKIVECRTRGHRNGKCAVCGGSCRVPILKRWLATPPGPP